MTVKEYLEQKLSPETVKLYLRDIKIYLDYQTEEQAKTANYQDILQYIEYLRKHYPKPQTINRMLYGVKAWYFWLIETNQRNDHPCRYLRLKDAKPKPLQLQDLFTEKELESLLDRKERYESIRIRNQVIISLLIYQALRQKEITNLKVQDIDLGSGTIFINASRGTNERKLQLKTNQVMMFYKYIDAARQGLLKSTTEKLIINLRGKPETGEGINYLIETFKNKFPDRNLNAKTIRQSVISNLLKPASAGGKGKGLREVQDFAGHKKISSTERYRQTGLEELKAAIQKYHPLG
jgi:integrase/recombinase XerD